jgi:hypothetical protein
MTDPHDDALARRLWELATGANDPDLERHLATCESCREELATLRPLARARAIAGGTLAEPPAALQDALVGLFGRIRPDLAAARPTTTDRIRDALRRIVAELVFDSAQTPQLSGLRAAGKATSRQIAYISDIADLDIEIANAGDHATVNGQLGMDDVPAGLVIAFAPDSEGSAVVEASLDREGHFVVTLPPGTWVATVRFDDATLVFPGFHL